MSQDSLPALAGIRLSALIAVVALAGCAHAGSTAGNAPAGPPVRVRTVAVRSVVFAPVLDLAGNVVASRQAVVGAMTTGRVVEMPVRIGDHVQAGDTIARIDGASYEAAYAQAAGSSAAAQANVSLARAQATEGQTKLALAAVTARRMAGLYGAGVISHQDNDEAQAALAAARAAYAQAQAGVAAAAGALAEARAGVTAARVPLADVLVRAPFDGTILARAVDPGAVVAVGSPIATLEDDRHLEVDVALPEDAVQAASVGSPVPIRIEALGATLSGQIRALVPSADPALRSVVIKIDLPPHSGLYAGMYARVRLAGPGHAGRAVPAAAVVERGGQDGVFAIEGNRAQFVPVQSGAVQNGLVELRDLPARVRRVAIAPVEQLTDGTRVAVH